MFTSASRLLLAGAYIFFGGVLGASVSRIGRRDGPNPGLAYDPNVIGYCTWWADVASSTDCSVVLKEYGITEVEFRRLNPTIPATCGVLPAGHSYCVEAFAMPSPSVSTASTSTSARTTSTSTKAASTTRVTTTAPPTTTTKPPGNGVTTPTPIQSGMVGNCNKFHYVEKDQTCTSVLALYSLSIAQFAQWNPAAKGDCSGLWSLTWACVGVIGGTPATTTTKTPATTTLPANGIATPTPTHPGMVSNCNKFVKVNPGDSCDGIAFFNGPISTENFVLWNAGVGGRECRGLQADTWACVGVIGGTPTTPGNGIATPTPTQPGMVNNCKKFVKVKPGDSCGLIAVNNGISLDNFVLWNTGVGGRECRMLQADTYVCIGV